MSTTQLQLGGGEADPERERPETFVVCAETGEFVLRSRRFEWPHDTIPLSAWFDAAADGEAESPYDEFDADEEVGGVFDITLEYSVTYRFRVPAYDKHVAEGIAEDWQLDATPADSYQVHTDRRKTRSIERQELPDDWDPYGREPIHEALDRVEDGDSE